MASIRLSYDIPPLIDAGRSTSINLLTRKWWRWRFMDLVKLSATWRVVEMWGRMITCRSKDSQNGVAVYFNVLGPLMVDMVGYDWYCTGIVSMKWSSRCLEKPSFVRGPCSHYDLRASNRHWSVLCLSRGLRDTILLLTLPRNNKPSQKNTPFDYGFPAARTTSLINITIGLQLKRRPTGKKWIKNKAQVGEPRR